MYIANESLHSLRRDKFQTRRPSNKYVILHILDTFRFEESTRLVQLQFYLICESFNSDLF